MQDTVFDPAKEAFDFVDRLNAMDDPEDVLDSFHSVLAFFGFQTVIVTGLPGPGERFEKMVILKHWPEEWFRLYTQGRYVEADPVAERSRVTAEPFEWDEARYDPATQPRAREIMHGACAFGMERGFCVPIHGLTGLESVVSMGGEDIDTTQRAKAAVHLMSVYVFNKTRRLLGAVQTETQLTEREREVLVWTASGKSAWETSCILGIASDTVNKHIASAMRKLNACNKTQAVAEAMRRGVLRL